MRITRLHLSDFKAHDELELTPAAGLTIVRGPNEAGKSSIQQALELALFRKADANREDIRQAWAWGSDSAPEVELAFEVDGRAGSLRKRFGGNRSEAELTLDGQTITDYQLIQDELAELIGVPTESFYRATASVSHADLGAVAGAEPAIGDRLQKAVSGADRGTAKARRKLEAAIHRYRTQGQKNPGLVKVARDEIESLERELADGEQALGRLQADRSQWVEANERRARLESQLTRQQADLSEAQRAEALAGKRDQARARYERLKRAVALVDEGELLRGEAPQALPLAQLRSTVSRLQALEFEASELEAELATTVEAAADDEPEELPPRPMRWLAAAGLLVMLGWLAMFLLRGSGTLGVIVVATIGVGVVVTLVQATRLAGRRRRNGLARQLAAGAADQHRERERDQQDELRRKQREIEAALTTLGVTDAAAADELLAAAERRTERLATIEGELRGLGVDDRGTRHLTEARDQAANEADQASHALAAMGSIGEDPVAARAEAQRQVAQTGPARDAARSEADQAQGRVDANPVDAELVAGLAERLSAAREQLALLEQRVGVYEATLAAIDAAEQATLKTAARYLEERMGPAIAEITDGRYDDIEVDERSLAFRVRAPETGELVAVEQLSQGTADQLFLAARLGLVRLVTLDRRPPIILDDPFVTFDHARGERALRLVKRFSREYGFQVIYLTCSDRYDELADELVVLPPPASERVAPASERVAVAPGPSAPPEPSAPPATAAPEPDAAEPSLTLRFEPDPRPNPDANAPRRPETVVPPRLTFAPDAARTPSRLAELRAARTARTGDDADPLSSLRRSASEAEAPASESDAGDAQTPDAGGGAAG